MWMVPGLPRRRRGDDADGPRVTATPPRPRRGRSPGRRDAAANDAHGPQTARTQVHGSDEAWLFDDGEGDAPLAVAMASYWTGLAVSATPNEVLARKTTDGAPRWPSFVSDGRVQILDDAIASSNATGRPECLDFWAQWLGYY